MLHPLQKPAKVKPRGQQFQSRSQIRKITTVSKQLYALFNIFELENSRLYSIPIFQNLVSEIKMFNRQLQDWKKNSHEIKNIVMTYHLYENLSARLKYLCNFSKNQRQAAFSCQEIMNWFYTEKPKLRCQTKQIKASMRPYTPQNKQLQRLEALVQTSELKRQMQPYEMMSRTAHSGLFPPKDRLKQYKRKSFLPFDAEKNPQQKNSMTAKKSTSATILSRNRLSKFRQSVGTMMTNSTLHETKSSFKKTVTQFKIPQIAQEKKQQKKEEQAQIQQVEENKDQKKQGENAQQIFDDLQRQKQVGQQEMLQANLQQNIGEQDQPDQDNILEQEDDKQKYKKVYISDHDPQELQYAEQEAKQAVQSTLRRNLKIGEDKVRSNMNELDLKRNMMNWAKIKAKINKDQLRKLESKQHLNKFKDIAYKAKGNLITAVEARDFEKGQKKFFNATTGFKAEKKPIQQPKQIVPCLYRSKSSHQGNMQSDIKKLKILQTMRVHQKYINHLPKQKQELEPKQKSSNVIGANYQSNQEQGRDFWSTSLTNLANRPNQKKTFSTLVNENNPDTYNQNAQLDMFRVKNMLSGKLISLQNNTIYGALAAVPVQQNASKGGIYTSGRDLLSNPFFPKHLFTAKKKKKKAK